MEAGGQFKTGLRPQFRAEPGRAWVIPNPKLRFLEQVREVRQVKHYALRTERAYCDWIRRYVRFHHMRSREELFAGTGKVEEFPNAAREWRWQCVVPTRDRSTDPRCGAVRRHHLEEASIQKALRAARARTRITKGSGVGGSGAGRCKGGATVAKAGQTGVVLELYRCIAGVFPVYIRPISGLYPV